ncbi:hypothetical protein D1AOALGA4SA_3766 [Olavius algarvensis Delta 1 endosymbiont]|nr:hypothetical protein D1AOALGA4SA_3766 [Olavius algarvensis Delta 1 endosymbiont]
MIRRRTGDPAVISSHREPVRLRPRMEKWNGGILEYRELRMIK